MKREWKFYSYIFKDVFVWLCLLNRFGYRVICIENGCYSQLAANVTTSRFMRVTSLTAFLIDFPQIHIQRKFLPVNPLFRLRCVEEKIIVFSQLATKNV